MLFMTESLDITPKTTEQNLVVCIGKSEAKVTNNKRLCSGYRIVLLKLTADGHEASHCLCDSRPSCFNKWLNTVV